MKKNREKREQSATKVADNTKKAKRRGLVSGILLVLQAILSLAFVVVAYKFLPLKYMIAAIVILTLDYALTYILMVLSMRQKKKSSANRKRIVGCVLSIITMIICAGGIFAMTRVHQTLDDMNEDTMRTKIGVYVLADDKAQNIVDAKDYQFGYTDNIDCDNTMLAFDSFKEKCGQELSKVSCESAMKMTDDLYAKQLGAIVINEAYVGVLSEMEGYEDFADKTKLIEEYTIEKKVVKRNKSEITTEPFVVYVSGSDTRDTKLSTARNDVNILAVVNPTTKQVLLLNTPRDCQIDLSIAPGNMDKLTHCGIYGIDCSMDTLSNFYGVDINYYAQINFTGIIKLVDTLGGVTVESDRAFRSTVKSSLNGDTRYDFVEGENTLNGLQALSFARERYAFREDDLARGVHQMALIKGLAKKIMSPAVLKDFNGLLDSVKDMSATSFTAEEMEALVQMQLDDPAEWNIMTYSVTGEYMNATVYSMPNRIVDTMVAAPKEVQQAKDLIEKVKNGDILTDADVEKQ